MKILSKLPSLLKMTFLVLAFGVMVNCGSESAADFNSEAACTDYCNKNFDCLDANPTQSEVDNCIDECRNSIEDNCGNDNQQAANDRIEECVDQSCDEFTVCMVYEPAPDCFGFVD